MLEGKRFSESQFLQTILFYLNNSYLHKVISVVFLGSIILGIVFYTSFIMSDDVIAETDFVGYLTGASIIRDGKGEMIYDLKTQDVYQKELLRPYNKPITLSYKNTPFVTLLFLPFTYLPLVQGYKLFVFINLMLLAFSTNLLAKVFKGIKKFKLWFLIPFVFFPSLWTIISGQTSFILLMVYLSMYYFIKSDKPFKQGMVSGLLLIKPQYIVGLPFFLLLAKRKTPFVKGFIFSSSILFIISAYLSGLNSLLSYPSFLLSTEIGAFGSYISRMFSLSSALFNIPEISKQGYIFVLIISAVFYLVTLFLYKMRYKLVGFEKSFISATLFSLVFAIHTQLHDLSILLVPIFILLEKLSTKQTVKGSFMVYLAGVLFLLPIVGWGINSVLATLLTFSLAIALLYLKPDFSRKIVRLKL